MPASYIDVLKNNNAILVHCSSHVSLIGSVHTFSLSPLEKINKVILGNNDISCSTIVAGDQPVHNYTGYAGVILAPRISSSITHASPSDLGSTPVLREKARTDGLIASPVDLENAITGRGSSYNEIFIHTYRVVGLFFTKPIYFVVGGAFIEIQDKELYSCFPSHDFYQCVNGSFLKVIYDEKQEVFSVVKACSASEIYS